MKSLSSYLSQDEIVLEELSLGLKEEMKISQIYQITEGNKFGDEGCIYLSEGLKKNKTVKKLNIDCMNTKYFLTDVFFRLWNHF